MIKGIDLLTHPNAEIIVISKGNSFGVSYNIYENIKISNTLVYENKQYNLLEKNIKMDDGVWIVTVIAEPI